MRLSVLFFTLLANLILQSTLFQYIRVFGIMPNFTVLIIVSYAILRGDIEGSAVGFAAGLIEDIFFSEIIGVSALMGFLLGYVCGKPFRDFFPENSLLPVFLSATGVLAYEFGGYFFTYLFRGETDFIYFFSNIILPGGVYTVIFTIPVYHLVYFINSKIEKREKVKRKLFNKDNI